MGPGGRSRDAAEELVGDDAEDRGEAGDGLAVKAELAPLIVGDDRLGAGSGIVSIETRPLPGCAQSCDNCPVAVEFGYA